MFEKKIFGATVRALRQGKACTQADLAAYLGVTKTQISDIENGKIATTIEKLVALADYFNVSLDYLCGRSDDPSFSPAAGRRPDGGKGT